MEPARLRLKDLFENLKWKGCGNVQLESDHDNSEYPSECYTFAYFKTKSIKCIEEILTEYDLFTKDTDTFWNLIETKFPKLLCNTAALNENQILQKKVHDLELMVEHLMNGVKNKKTILEMIKQKSVKETLEEYSFVTKTYTADLTGVVIFFDEPRIVANVRVSDQWYYRNVYFEDLLCEDSYLKHMDKIKNCPPRRPKPWEILWLCINPRI